MPTRSSTRPFPRPAVFLDRDDTLIACNSLPPPPVPAKRGDLIDPSLVRLLDGVPEGLARLARAGFCLVVVSNQGVVARGGGTLAHVDAVNARVRALLRPAGVQIRAFFACPFHPEGLVPEFAREHPWRKPAPGMILAAARVLNLDLSESFLIGDAARDVEAGLAAGLDASRCLRVEGEGDFSSAVDRVLSMHARRRASSSSLTLRALSGTPLDEPMVRATVISAAHAIAERTGITIHHLATHPDAITVTLGAGELASLGFLAELRRATNAWYESKFHDGPLWGTPPPGSHDRPDGPPDDAPHWDEG